MLKRMLLLLAMLAICLPAVAAEDDEDGGEDPKPKKVRKAKRPPRKGRRGRGLAAPKGLVESCWVLKRLQFSEEQQAKIKELDGELSKKFEELKTEAGNDRKKQGAAAKKLNEAVVAAKAKVVELLTEEQKQKYTAGQAVLTQFRTAVNEARKEIRKAGRDKKKRAEATKAFKAKEKELVEARDKGLDEKVGKLPGAEDGGEAKE
jgi:hypothetical protein